MMVRLAAVALRKAFGETQALRGLSLTIQAGEAYGLVGPDGAGKTTALRLLAGVMSPDSGTVHIGGHDLGSDPEAARAGLGYLSQRFSLYPDLTVGENLTFFGSLRGLAGAALRARAPTLLRFVGLAGAEQRLAGQLSGGMKQKLGLAVALLHRPTLLLLDEPTGGVDPIARQDFWQLIIRLLGEGLAVVVSTPYMDEALRCSRLGFLWQGRLLTEGSPRALMQPFQGHILELAAHPREAARALCLTDPEVEEVIPFGTTLHLRVRHADGPLARLPALLAAHAIPVSYLRPIPPTLEDVFIALLAAGTRQGPEDA